MQFMKRVALDGISKSTSTVLQERLWLTEMDQSSVAFLLCLWHAKLPPMIGRLP